MNTPQKTNSLKVGFTLTEMAIVLSVIGGVVATIWAVAADVSMNNHVSMAHKQLTAIVGNVRVLYAEQSGIKGTTGVLTPALDQLRVFPLEMRHNAAGTYGNIYHDWSVAPGPGGLGNVQIAAASCATGTTNGNTIESCFGVFFYSLKQTACAQFLTAAITGGRSGGASTGTGLKAVYVNGNSVAFPIDMGTANSAANCGASATANSVEWVYLLKDNALQ